MRKAVLLVFAVCTAAAWVHAQDPKFTALFIINFAKYVDWPGDSGDFVITVLGDDPVNDELSVIAEKTKIGERTLVIRTCADFGKVGKTNIIYVTPGKSDALSEVVKKFGGGGVLIVSNQEGLAEQGAAINLAMIDGKQRYEINQGSLKKTGLVAKPVLFKLGKVVGS